MLKNTPFITNGILRALNYNWKITCIFKYIAVTLTFVLITSLMVVFPISVFADEGTAYNGPHNVPCTVEAEDFNSGDEKAAYHEVDIDSNTTYRTSDVDITSSGGLIYIHNTQNNEWLKYTVNVSTAGWYKISMRFSNYNSDNNKQHILVCVDNMMKGVVEIPQTGGETTFTSVDGPQYVYLTQGNHIIFFQMYEKCNFDYLQYRHKLHQTGNRRV